MKWEVIHVYGLFLLNCGKIFILKVGLLYLIDLKGFIKINSIGVKIDFHMK